MYKAFHPWFLLHIFLNFSEKKPSTKFYDVFDHSSRIYKVTMFYMIKLWFELSDVIHSNENN